MNNSLEFMLQSGSLLAGSEQQLAAINNQQLQPWKSAYSANVFVCPFLRKTHCLTRNIQNNQDKEFSKFKKTTSSTSAKPYVNVEKKQFLFKACSNYNPVGNWRGFAARQIHNANLAIRVVLAHSVIKLFRKKILSYSFGKQDAISSVEHFLEMVVDEVFFLFVPANTQQSNVIISPINKNL